MGIIGQIKQISTSTLELLKEDPLLIDAFFAAKWLPESAFWQRTSWYAGESAEKTKQEARARFGRLPSPQGLWKFIPGKGKHWKKAYDWQALEEQFLAEWETPELDLHKYWQEITFLLAGYVPGYMTSQWRIPELTVSKKFKKDFLSFLVIKNSVWDGFPLVNAFGAGTEIGDETGYGYDRYLLPSEVEQILDGLLELSLEGYQNRFIRESQKAEPLPWIDWSEDKAEMLDWMTDYYNEMVDFYRCAVSQHQALLLYLT